LSSLFCFCCCCYLFGVCVCVFSVTFGVSLGVCEVGLVRREPTFKNLGMLSAWWTHSLRPMDQCALGTTRFVSDQAGGVVHPVQQHD
jgi:hypothetical protein